jgi:hypothetical protein
MAQPKSVTTPSAKLSKKEMRQLASARRQLYSRLTWGAVVVLALGALGYAGWQVFRPRPGVSVPQMGREHIQVGDPHEPYNTDPPTSGPHYAQPVSAGFYDVATPDENLVHNLEHGYVVISYNCAGMDAAACDAFKAQIRGVMDRAGTVDLLGATKVIAVPRSTLPGPIAATSWGRLYQPEAFDAAELLTFIKEFRKKAPEPDAP